MATYFLVVLSSHPNLAAQLREIGKLARVVGENLQQRPS
jgi:hypothetical protein